MWAVARHREFTLPLLRLDAHTESWTRTLKEVRNNALCDRDYSMNRHDVLTAAGLLLAWVGSSLVAEFQRPDRRKAEGAGKAAKRAPVRPATGRFAS